MQCLNTHNRCMQSRPRMHPLIRAHGLGRGMQFPVPAIRLCHTYRLVIQRLPHTYRNRFLHDSKIPCTFQHRLQSQPWKRRETFHTHFHHRSCPRRSFHRHQSGCNPRRMQYTHHPERDGWLCTRTCFLSCLPWTNNHKPDLTQRHRPHLCLGHSLPTG